MTKILSPGTTRQPDNSQRKLGIDIALFSLHGLIRFHDAELGRDADTGGQVKYVLELAEELSRQPEVDQVHLFTRQIFDAKVDDAYSQIEESISPNAKIIRLPFGPKRYLRKEALWPYIELFIDQTLTYFRRHGLPNVIHGHYADAGLAGAQLARLLHIPFVFTGHSLGRVKRERLVESKKEPAALERTYKLSVRIEAEEIALETASLVVASTNQEVEQQYQVYENYVSDRMEVIPPGVNLDSFYPSDSANVDADRELVAELLNPFLRQPDKPIILAMARPDERKNLEMLVEVFGNSAELQSLANLVVLMGSRDDLREIAAGQRNVLLNVLTLIDVYDLHGKVAYPKQHRPEQVAALYRVGAAGHGVFVNPALTEPFGLTLLEAAASGLPIVATNDGGPRDIVANCQNGLLVDPLDPEAIERALIRVLTETDQWDQWSQNGIEGVNRHYSWTQHARRYLRDVQDILDHSATPALVKSDSRNSRRLPDFERLIITDLDNTLTGDEAALAEFNALIRDHDYIGFGIATGRSLPDAQAMIEQLGLPSPDVLDTSCGTQLHYGENLIPDLSWERQIGHQWDRAGVEQALAKLPGLFLQVAKNQSRYKISYELDLQTAPKINEIKRILRSAGLRAKVIISREIYLDVIPVRGGSDLSIRHLLYKWGFAPEQLLVAGDSGNDEGMLKGRTLGVVVANHSPELEKLKKSPRVYFAESEHAAGIIEGINYYNFLDKIVIPNDRLE